MGYKLTLQGKITLLLIIAILVMLVVLIGNALTPAILSADAPEDGPTSSTVLWKDPSEAFGGGDAQPGESENSDIAGTKTNSEVVSPFDEEAESEGSPEEGSREPELVIYFDPDSFVLTREQAVALDMWYESAELSGSTVVLEGHAFSREPDYDQYAEDLGLARANRVAYHLEQLGLSRDSMTVVSNGGEDPFPPEADGSHWRTRRVEVYLVPAD